MTDEAGNRQEELAYIKYSAKELLFHQAQQIDALQKDVNNIMLNMVTRAELNTARRWAIGALIAAVGALASVFRALGV